MLKPQTDIEKPWIRQRLLVPRSDGTLFSKPSLAEVPELAKQNQLRFSESSEPIFFGRSLAEFRTWTRSEILDLAGRYTSSLTGQPSPSTAGDLLFVSGHQPALFHPGVLVKNFAVAELANRTGGVGLNLIVDNDMLSTPTVRLPAGDFCEPTVHTVEFDEPQPPQPWEDATIQNAELFSSFPDRTVQALQPWKIDPLVTEIWPAACVVAKRTKSLVNALTAARCQLERNFGFGNLELPMSQLCDSEPFRWFFCHLVANLPKFRDVHNQVLDQYRSINRIRSQTHPVPGLTEHDGWLEAPFWVWSLDDKQRKRIFVRQLDGQIELSDGKTAFCKLTLNSESDIAAAVDQLATLAKQGLKIRTRALTTTLFARLCLSDLFVHGIGGAKYDEMTDRILSRFYQVSAPAFSTLSATLHLPFEQHFNVTQADVLRLNQLSRDLKFNSDRHLSDGRSTEAISLIEQKRALIVQQQQAKNRTGLSRNERKSHRWENHQRYQRFQKIDRQLVKFTETQQRQLSEEVQLLNQQLAANTVLEDREYSFCLYHAEKLQNFMCQLWEL